MAQRGIVDKLFTFDVVAGAATVRLDFGFSNLPTETIAGYLTHIRLIAPSGNPKGRLSIFSVGLSRDKHKDPKTGDPDIRLDDYQYEMKLPVNGVYDLKLTSVNQDGTGWEAIVSIQEVPRSVL